MARGTTHALNVALALLILTAAPLADAHAAIIPSLVAEERVIIRTPDSNTDAFRGPGHQLMGSYVSAPVHKLLRQTEREFLRPAEHHLLEKLSCTSADGPFCHVREQHPTATSMGSMEPSMLVQEVTHKLIFAQLLRRATGSVLVLFHAAGADARCATCGLAHDELRDAAAELRAVGAEVPVLSVDCSTPAGTALCAQQGVVKRDLPDVRLYFGSAAASVRFLSDAAAAGVAGAADDMTHNLGGGQEEGALGWTSASLVSFVTDTRMHQLFSMVAQFSEGGRSTVIPGLNTINFAEDGTVVLNPDDNLLDSLRAMGLEVPAEGESDEEEDDADQGVASRAERGEKGGGGDAPPVIEALFGAPMGTDSRSKAASKEGGDEKVQGVRVKSLMSMPTQIARHVEFRNLSKKTVQLLWVDFKGVEQKYSVLHPGERQVISSFVNHVWLLREIILSTSALKVAVVMNGVGTQHVHLQD